MLTQDIVHEPQFVESDGICSVGDEVWAETRSAWVWCKILQIRYDQSLKLSRYLIRNYPESKEQWVSMIVSMEYLLKN
jgi:hypothetical protein